MDEIQIDQGLNPVPDEAPSPGVATPATPEAPAHVIYVGPRLVRPFPVAALAVFRGPMPPPLAQAVAGDPDLAACFVPVAEAGTALRAVSRPGTALARAVTAVRDKYLPQKKEG